jgi:hypothetical protein
VKLAPQPDVAEVRRGQLMGLALVPLAYFVQRFTNVASFGSLWFWLLVGVVTLGYAPCAFLFFSGCGAVMETSPGPVDGGWRRVVLQAGAGKAMETTRRKLMIATWSPPSEGESTRPPS